MNVCNAYDGGQGDFGGVVGGSRQREKCRGDSGRAACRMLSTTTVAAPPSKRGRRLLGAMRMCVQRTTSIFHHNVIGPVVLARISIVVDQVVPPGKFSSRRSISRFTSHGELPFLASLCPSLVHTSRRLGHASDRHLAECYMRVQHPKPSLITLKFETRTFVCNLRVFSAICNERMIHCFCYVVCNRK